MLHDLMCAPTNTTFYSASETKPKEIESLIRINWLRVTPVQRTEDECVGFTHITNVKDTTQLGLALELEAANSYHWVIGVPLRPLGLANLVPVALASEILFSWLLR